MTFLINSAAHSSWAGARPYSGGVTARNATWLIIRLKEGYHNFHHTFTFPSDHRIGIRWYETDPTCYLLLDLSFCQCGMELIWDLNTTSESKVEQATRQQQGLHEVTEFRNNLDLAHMK